MDKRLGLAIAISMVILFAWWKLFPPATPPPPSQGRPAASAPPASKGAPAPAAEVAAAPAAAPAQRPAEERITLSTKEAEFVLSSYGAALREVRLTDERFRRKKGDPATAEQLVDTATPQTAPLRTTFPKADFKLPDDPIWAVQRPAPDAVVFRTETDEVVVEKRYRALPERFQLELQVTVTNKAAKSAAYGMAVHLYGKQDPDKKGGGFLDYASADVAEMVCFVGDEVHRKDIEGLLKEPQEHVGPVRWIAADEKFFTVALAAGPDAAQAERKCGMRGLDHLTGEVFLSVAARSVPPGQQATHSFVAFAGPKTSEALQAVAVEGQTANLDQVVNVSFAVLARPLLYLLKAFHRFAGNWGVAIILLTLFVKLVTFYPTQRTMMSAKKMQRLAPKMAALRKKYENDKQKLGLETMNLYKSEGVSPFGGCLPSLIQMPIWIALFSTLNYAVELHRASFLYISDLSARDPYYLAPLLMGAVMFLQMRMAPAGADPQQQKMMAIMMPVMFTGFSLFLPAGLAIYTLTSYLIGILQQVYVNWVDRKRHGPMPVVS